MVDILIWMDNWPIAFFTDNLPFNFLTYEIINYLIIILTVTEKKKKEKEKLVNKSPVSFRLFNSDLWLFKQLPKRLIQPVVRNNDGKRAEKSDDTWEIIIFQRALEAFVNIMSLRPTCRNFPFSPPSLPLFSRFARKNISEQRILFEARRKGLGKKRERERE